LSFNFIKRAVSNARELSLGIEQAIAINGSCKKQIAALGEPTNPLLLSHLGHGLLVGFSIKKIRRSPPGRRRLFR
jgi:hypothetical protein